MLPLLPTVSDQMWEVCFPFVLQLAETMRLYRSPLRLFRPSLGGPRVEGKHGSHFVGSSANTFAFSRAAAEAS